MVKSQNYISIPQLAKILGLSRIAVYKKVKKGSIPGVKIGRNFVISRDYLNKRVESKEFTSITQLAAELNLERTTVYKKIKAGVIKGTQAGNTFIIAKNETRQISEQKKNYVSIPELAQALGISRIAVYQKVKKGTIPAKRIGKKFLISKEYLKGKSSVFLKKRKPKIF